MKSNDVEKNKLVELLKKQHTGKLIFSCKQRVTLHVVSELIGRVSASAIEHCEVDKYMAVVNELFLGIDKNGKWLEIELEALEYFAKHYIVCGANDKEVLIERVNTAKALINKALAELK